MQPLDHWDTWRKIASRSFSFSFATVNPDGTPHVTPIGSLILCKDEPRGFYLPLFTNQMTQNLKHNNRVSILAVNSSKWFWLRSFCLGKFSTPPGVRLSGIVGEKRLLTPDEIKMVEKRIGIGIKLKGITYLSKNLKYAQDIYFDSVKMVSIGKMTKDILC